MGSLVYAKDYTDKEAYAYELSLCKTKSDVDRLKIEYSVGETLVSNEEYIYDLTGKKLVRITKEEYIDIRNKQVDTFIEYWYTPEETKYIICYWNKINDKHSFCDNHLFCDKHWFVAVNYIDENQTDLIRYKRTTNMNDDLCYFFKIVNEDEE